MSRRFSDACTYELRAKTEQSHLPDQAIVLHAFCYSLRYRHGIACLFAYVAIDDCVAYTSLLHDQQ